MGTDSIKIRVEKDAKDYEFWQRKSEWILVYSHSESKETLEDGVVLTTREINYVPIKEEINGSPIVSREEFSEEDKIIEISSIEQKNKK